MKYTPLNFISTQLSKVPPVPTTDLTGKVVVVTGSGVGGMGYEAAKHFSTMNPAKIIIAVRSQQRGQETVDSTWISPISFPDITDPLWFLQNYARKRATRKQRWPS